MIPYEQLLYARDATLTSVHVTVLGRDVDSNRLRLDRTAHYPGGGGQPADHCVLRHAHRSYTVTRAEFRNGQLWHELGDLGDREALPAVGSVLEQEIDAERRLLLSRTHSALHVVCGVLYRRCEARTTGANMEPGSGRLDFATVGMNGADAQEIEGEVNEEIAAARPIRVDFVARKQADDDPALIRARADLIPRSVDPLRVIDIVGLDRQADGGTHVADTSLIGPVRIVKIENKGAANKRVRIALQDRV